MRSSFFLLLLHLMAGFAMLYASSACHKAPVPDCPAGLPCATRTGENTLGCYINGKAWMAERPPELFPGFFPPVQASYSETNIGFIPNRLRISANRTNDTLDGDIYLNFQPVAGIGDISHVGAVTFDVRGFMKRKKNERIVGISIFALDTLFDYHIEITHLDTDQRIIAGRFSFTGISSKQPLIVGYGVVGVNDTLYSEVDTVRVTDGRFDIKYRRE